MTTASIRITTADRDESGKIKVEAPRPLAELLPEPSEVAHEDSRPGSSISRENEGDKEAPRRPSREHLLTAAGIAGGLIAAALLIALIGVTSPTAPALPARPAPTVAPTAAPVPTSAPPSAPPAARIVVAFAAPDGAVLGGFDAGREQLTIVGRYGDGWAQVRRADGSEVWMRVSDLDQAGQDALATAPDLAPPTPRPAPAAVPVVVPPAPPQAPAPPVPATPAPTEVPAPTVDTLATTIARNQAAIDATYTAIAATYAQIQATSVAQAAGYPTVQAQMPSGGVPVGRP
jgi:hypothetical protein